MVQVLFTILFLCVAALFVWRGIAFGKRYTWIYSAARTVSVILAILLSVLCAAGLSRFLVDLVLTGLGGAMGTFGNLMVEVPTLKDAVCAIAAMILAPLFFYIFFFILKGILCAVSMPISKLIVRLAKVNLGEKKEPVADAQAEQTAEPVSTEIAEPVQAKPEKIKKPKKRDALRVQGKRNPLGMVLGAVCSLLMFFALMSPLVGFLGIANDTVGLVANIVDLDAMDLAYEVTDGMANNVGAKAVRLCGGDAIYSGLTTYRVGKYKVSLRREMALVVSVGEAVADYRNSSLASGEVAYSLRQTADAFDQSSLIPALVPDFLSAANTQWEQGRTFHGIKKPNLGNNLSGIAEPALELLATSDYKTVKGDVRTGVEIFATIIENDGLRGGKTGKALLTDETICTGIMQKLLENEHLSPLVGDVLAFGFDEIGHRIGAHFDGDPIEDPSVPMASMDQMVIDSAHVQDKAREAKIYADILRQTLSLAESMGGQFNAVTCIRDIGPVLDLLSDSETVGKESTAIFLTCILQSKKVYGEVGFTLQEATNLASSVTRDIGTTNANGTVNTYSMLMKSVSDAVKIVQASSKKEDYRETVSSLMNDLTPTSANVISQMLTTNVMEQHGVSGESAEVTSSLISSVFTNLADERQAGMSDEEYERETNAVMNMTDLALNAGTEGTDGAFGEGSATGVSAGEFVGNILDSKVVSGAMKEQVFTEGSSEPTIDPLNKGAHLSEEDTADLNAALSDRWAALTPEEQQDAETIKTYQAIGAMVGMEVEFTPGSITLK